jgi:hypothetical protein
MIAFGHEQDWEGQVAAEPVERVAAEGAFGARTEMLVKTFPGRPRAMVLSGIALFPSAGDMGEATTVRSAGGGRHGRVNRLEVSGYTGPTARGRPRRSPPTP